MEMKREVETAAAGAKQGRQTQSDLSVSCPLFISCLCLISAPFFPFPFVGFMVVCRLSGALIYSHTGDFIFHLTISPVGAQTRIIWKFAGEKTGGADWPVCNDCL